MNLLLYVCNICELYLVVQIYVIEALLLKFVTILCADKFIFSISPMTQLMLWKAVFVKTILLIASKAILRTQSYVETRFKV